MFDLNALQDEYRDEGGSVLEVDLYHAQALLPLSDDALAQRLLQVGAAFALICLVLSTLMPRGG